MIKLAVATVLLFGGISLDVCAASLWTYSHTAEPNGLVLHNKVQQKGRLVHLDVTRIQQLSVGDIIDLFVSESLFYPAKLQRVEINGSGSYSYFLTIDSNNEDLPVVVTIGRDQVYARVVTPVGVYVLSGFDNKGWLLNESELINTGKKLHQSDVILAPRRSRIAINSIEKDIVPPIAKVPAPLKINSDEQANIDVLVVYPENVIALYKGDVQSRIDQIIAVTNQIYQDSNVYIKLNVAGTVVVDYPSSFTQEEALTAITFAEHEAFTDIEKIRFETGADVVIFLRSYENGDASGIAYGNGADGSITRDSRTMYSVSDIEGADYINAHELGHNFGLAHDRRDDDFSGEGYTFPFALGHGVDDQFVTIMAYPIHYHSNLKFYKFSSPNLDCNGSPCGIDRSDLEQGADAVFALNAVRFEAEALFDRALNLTAITNELSNLTDVNLQECIQSEAIEYVEALTSVDCVDTSIQNISGLGAFTSITDVDLSNNEIVDISPLVNLKSVTFLNLYFNNISDVGALSTLTELTVIDLTGNNVQDVTVLFGLIDTLDYLSLFGNNNVYCWQMRYIKEFFTSADIYLPNACDSAQDFLDYDSDGIANIDELNNGDNPVIASVNNISDEPSAAEQPTRKSKKRGLGNVDALFLVLMLFSVVVRFNTISRCKKS